MESEAWRPGVVEKLAFYVYLLVDPRDGRPFYVGKGLGNRCFSHLWEARNTDRDTTRDYVKLQTIREIEDAGLAVRVEILRHGLTEAESFLVEAVAIDLLGFGELANRVLGHGTGYHGRMFVEDVNALYGARPVEISSTDRVVLITVARTFEPGISDEKLYERTRKWWRMNPGRRPDYAFAVSGGVVRAVYQIEEWIEPRADDVVIDPKREGRFGFIGHRDGPMEGKYYLSDVRAYVGQNPIRYVNC